MGKLIDADALKATIMSGSENMSDGVDDLITLLVLKLVCMTIDGQPEEIVRCSDCIHAGYDSIFDQWWCHKCIGDTVCQTKPDKFCSDGRRKYEVQCNNPGT